MPYYVPLVRASVLRSFTAFLGGIGVRVRPLVEQSRLPEVALADPETLIPLRLTWEFTERAARAAEIENLGLRVGAQTPLGALGAYGRAVCRLSTLYQALETATWLIAAHSSGERLWLTWHGEQVRVCHAFIHRIERGQTQAEQFTLMVLVNLLSSVAGSGWRPEKVELASLAPAAISDMAIFSKASLSSGHRYTAITFPRALLRMPLKHRMDGAGAPIHDDEALAASAPAVDFPGSVRQLIASYLREGYPDLHHIASIAGISERTFQRRLMESGTTYYGLVDQARLERARGYLMDPRIKLIDVALELGFSEAASFTRAFRRWTGSPPSAFRRLARMPAGAGAEPRAPGHGRRTPVRRPAAAA